MLSSSDFFLLTLNVNYVNLNDYILNIIIIQIIF